MRLLAERNNVTSSFVIEQLYGVIDLLLPWDLVGSNDYFIIYRALPPHMRALESIKLNGQPFVNWSICRNLIFPPCKHYGHGQTQLHA
jgi:hypothetical protein